MFTDSNLLGPTETQKKTKTGGKNFEKKGSVGNTLSVQKETQTLLNLEPQFGGQEGTPTRTKQQGLIQGKANWLILKRDRRVRRSKLVLG